LDKLPEPLFAQGHRSFVVNLQRVKKIKKEGQTYQLFVDGIDGFLPASRHRASVFLPKLEAILNPNVAILR
jgi:DNA-binding LytR/AlgR family response regulator